MRAMGRRGFIPGGKIAYYSTNIEYFEPSPVTIAQHVKHARMSALAEETGSLA